MPASWLTSAEILRISEAEFLKDQVESWWCESLGRIPLPCMHLPEPGTRPKSIAGAPETSQRQPTTGQAGLALLRRVQVRLEVLTRLLASSIASSVR